MTQVLIDTGLPCFDDVLAKYAFTFRIQWSVCKNRIIMTPEKNMVLALFGFTLLQNLDVSMCFFFFLVVILFLFLFFF
jgi:hypothetical protein